MKKLIIFMLLMAWPITAAIAGDVPEGLLGEDGAEVFFAEVVEYNAESDTAKLNVVDAIKGDVEPGKTREYRQIVSVGFEPEPGGVYLAAYFDENNPTYLFETTSTITAKLKLKKISGAAMWKRFEEYLNNGDFEEAERERRDRINAKNSLEEKITLVEFLETERDNAEKVYIYNNIEQRVEVSRDKFFDFAEKTVLTKVREVKPADMNGSCIEIYNKDGTSSFGYISLKGEADRYSMMMSRLPAGVYTVRMSAVEELSGLMKASANGAGYVSLVVIAALAVTAAMIYGKRKNKK